MGVRRRLIRFGGGGLLGAGLGGVVAILFAPESGEDLRRRLRERLLQIRLAGAEAQARKTDELVRKFRATVNDPTALAETEAQAREQMALAAPSVAPVQPAHQPSSD